MENATSKLTCSQLRKEARGNIDDGERMGLYGWMDFISPGGTEPKGPWLANYIRFVHFALVSYKPLRFSSINATPCLFSQL